MRIVLYDDDDGLIAPAAERLANLGYTNVGRLAGGLPAWRAAGYEIFIDVNSYSMAFGELVEARRHTPSVSAQDLQARLQSRDNLVVLDARRFDEYQTMNIPTGVSAPGAELVLRARALAADPATTIVVNCAGRTRSIIGAQSLLNAGYRNPVYALRNGAIGWTLAEQTLERGAERRAPAPDAEAASEAAAKSAAVAYKAGAKRIDAAALKALAADTTRTLYRFDVPHAGRIRGRTYFRFSRRARRPARSGDRCFRARARRAHRTGR